MTAKFRSPSVIPIVSQICSASASSCALRKRIARGAAVVPEVSLSNTGTHSPQSIGSPGSSRAISFSGAVIKPADAAGFQGRSALTLTDRLLDRQNHDPAPQTGEKKGRPMGVVPDLDRDDLARRKILQPTLFCPAAAQFLDFAEAKKDPPLGVENRRLVAPLRPRLVPGREQRVSRIHHLRPALSAATVQTLFPT